MAKANITLLLCLVFLGAPALAHAECFGTVSAMKANHVKTRWQETTANDGKPMVISISDGGGSLVYTGKKAGVQWLSGNVSVCQSGGSTNITLKNTKATSHVPMLARMAMPKSQSGQITGNQITLGGKGWSGTFVGL